MRILLTCLALFSFAANCLAQNPTIQMQAQPVWTGSDIGSGVPIYVDLQNMGASVQGNIEVTGYGEPSVVEYPVDLPSGSKKRILFVPEGIYDNTVQFKHNLGVKEAKVAGSTLNSQSHIGLISDNPSDLIFIEGNSNNAERAFSAGGCRPEDAPDRLIGYYHLSSLILAEGSERLRDSQIKAIEAYARGGGIVIFVGGASPSAATDSRWQKLLPILSGQVRNTTIQGKVASEIYGQTRPDSKAIQGLKLGKGYLRSYGLGMVVHYSVNPFESPVKGMDDRRADVLKCLFRSHRNNAITSLNYQVGLQSSDYDYSAPPPAFTSYSASSSSVEVDPFQIKAPQVNQLAVLLIAYIIVVLPINFFILRRLKKMEFAWVTTPIISVIFSGILLSSTVNLYRSTEVTRTLAMLATAGGDPEGTLVARSEMFFPSAKNYDLGLKGIDRVHSTSSYQYRRSANQASRLQLLDVGKGVIAPSVSTTNLAFREFGYMGTDSAASKVLVSYKREGKMIIVSVNNQTNSKLTGIRIFTPNGSFTPKELESIIAGKTATYRYQQTPTNNETKSGLTWIANASPTQMVLLGAIEGVRVGPSYGRQHPASMTYFVTTPVWGEQV